MNITRNGKIARLPKDIREELNERLCNGESGKSLVRWLNSQPEVQAVLAEEFAGKAIRQQNLSEWKQGGYEDWLKQQEALELAERMVENGEELAAVSTGPLTDKLAVWLTARYLAATRKLEGGADEDGQAWKRLREFCNDLVALRRGDHHAQRLELESQKQAEARTKGQAKALQLCLEDSKNYPEVMEKFKAVFREFAEQKQGRRSG